MSSAIYPSAVKGGTFPSARTMENSVIIQTSQNKSETRILLTENPVWHWELSYDYLKDYPQGAAFDYTDLRKLIGFFAARGNQYEDFLYKDPDDNAVGPAIFNALPNLQAQLQVFDDGSGNKYSPIQRNMGGLFYEDITDLNSVGFTPGTPPNYQWPITVYANGVAQIQDQVGPVPHDYSVIGPGVAIPGNSWMGLVIKWNAPPATPVTAQFGYYFRVRFEESTQPFEKFLRQLWTIGGSEARSSQSIKLVTARVPAA